MAVVVALVRTNWAGTSGGPGLTQMAVEAIADPHTWDATTAQQAVDDVRAMWDAIKAYLPNEVVLTVSPVVDIYNIQSGELVGSHTAAVPPANVGGTDTGAYMMAAGVKVNLLTTVIRNGRRVRGAVFIVPAGSTTMGLTGVVVSGARTAIAAAFNTLRGALVTDNHQLVVWSRNKALVGVGNGATSPVNGIDVGEKGAVLRGRRD